jgi:Ca-activated chloride channel family protein
MDLASTLKIEWPWLLSLVPLPILAYWILPAVAAQRYAALKVPFFKALSSLAQGSYQASARSLGCWLLAGLIWMLLVLAATNPLWMGEPVAIEQSGRDLLLALDLSPSMANPDMILGSEQVTRLSLVKKAARQFIDGRKGDRLGLVVFGEQAYLLTPLTADHQTLKEMLEDATAGLAGDRTAIGDAIGLGIKRLMPYPKNSRVLILLTDGGNNAGNIDPISAAREAAKLDIKIYTVGLGANEMIVRDFLGSHRINPSADLDEKSLQKIAELTGGRYFRATDTASLENALQEMDKLEPALNDKATYRPQTPLYPWILLVALFLLLLLMLPQGLERTLRRERI